MVFTGCRFLDEPVYTKPFVQVVIVFGKDRTWAVTGLWFSFIFLTVAPWETEVR